MKYGDFTGTAVVKRCESLGSPVFKRETGLCLKKLTKKVFITSSKAAISFNTKTRNNRTERILLFLDSFYVC
jgi:hypothetical protein